jgi:hypothetical protein
MRAILQQLCEEVIKKYKKDLKKDRRADQVETMRAAELEIEEFKRAVGQQMMATYTAVRSEQASEQMKRCACGETLKAHHWSEWPHGTLHAEVVIRDPYGYCRTCHVTQRPLHGLLGMEPTRWSLAVQRAAVDFGADHGFGKSEAKMQEHYPDTPMGKSSLRNRVLGHGREMVEYLHEKLERATVIGLDQPWRRPGVARLEVEHDASFIRTGQLEPKACAAGEPAVTAVRGLPRRQRRTEWKQVTLGVVHEPGQVDVLYCGRYGESEPAFDDLFGLACLAGWSLATDVTGIADGAPHIRTQLEERFRVRRPACVARAGPRESHFQFILDRPHAQQHLFAVGEILGPRQHKTAQTWAEEKIKRLDEGHAAQVVAQLTRAAQRLKNDTLRQAAHYFAKNQDAVHYNRFKAEGRSIASGIVESGHKHVLQERLKLPGTWWHPENVDPMVALRVLRANHWWDEYWTAQALQYQKRAGELRRQHLAAAA